MMKCVQGGICETKGGRDAVSFSLQQNYLFFHTSPKWVISRYSNMINAVGTINENDMLAIRDELRAATRFDPVTLLCNLKCYGFIILGEILKYHL